MPSTAAAIVTLIVPSATWLSTSTRCTSRSLIRTHPTCHLRSLIPKQGQ